MLKITFSLILSLFIALPVSANTKSKILQNLGKKEEKIWEKLAAYSIEKKEFDDMKESLKNRTFILPDKITGPAPQEILSLFDRALSDFNMQKFGIKMYAGNQHSAQAFDKEILINVKKIKERGNFSILFCIGHEINHLIANDVLNQIAFEELLRKKNIEKKIVEPLLNEYRRFTEERADILAACKGYAYAQGYADTFNKSLILSSDSKGITHPKKSFRLKTAYLIINSIYRKERALYVFVKSFKHFFNF